MASRRNNEISLEKHEFREMRHGNRTKIAETVGVYFISGLLLALAIMLGIFLFTKYGTDVSVSLSTPRTSLAIAVQEQDDEYLFMPLIQSWAGSLRLKSNTSVIVGTTAGVCAELNNTAYYCTEHYAFNGQGGIPEGSIDAAGISITDSNLTHWAVTGGTGYYHYATGDLNFTSILGGTAYPTNFSVLWVN